VPECAATNDLIVVEYATCPSPKSGTDRTLSGLARAVFLALTRPSFRPLPAAIGTRSVAFFGLALLAASALPVSAQFTAYDGFGQLSGADGGDADPTTKPSNALIFDTP